MPLATQGFGLSDLPSTPVVPGNLGNVNPIDFAKVAALTQQNLASQRAQQQIDLERQQQQSTLASQAQQRQQSAQLFPVTLAGQTGQALQQQAAGTVAQSGVPVQQAQQGVQLRQIGQPVQETVNTVRNPDGTVSFTKNVSQGGVGQQSTSETYPAPVITPIGNINGVPSANTISTVGPDGRPIVSVVQNPLAAVAARGNTGSSRVVVGTTIDPQGNTVALVQNMVQSAFDSAPRPVGSPAHVTVDANTDPAILSQIQNAPKTAISSTGMKSLNESQETLKALQGKQLEIENISNAAENFINQNGAGRFTGPLELALGNAKAQEFQGSVVNALSSALTPLRGTGRVSQQEFNQALGALPTIRDQPEAIESKIKYLNLVNDLGIAREKSYQEALSQGLNTYEALLYAQQQNPQPQVPNFVTGQSAPAPSGQNPAAPGQAPAQTAQLTPEQRQILTNNLSKNPNGPVAQRTRKVLGLP